MLNRRTTTLGELLDSDGGEIKTGPFGTKLKAAEYTPTGVPVISVGEVGYGRLRLHEGTPRVDASVTNRMPEYLLRYGDIVFGRKGAVDRSARVQRDQDGWFLGSDGIRVRLPSSCDSAFIAYQLQVPTHRDWMIQHAAGSTMPSLNEGIIRRIPIVLPSLDDQRAIADVLGSLDDKIEQNRRTGAKLEGLARAVFKAWFVDFEPVKAKAAGASSFPGMPAETFATLPNRLVDSEVGLAPEGWEVGKLGDVIDIHDSRRIPLSKKQRDDRRGGYRYYGAAGVVDYVDDFLFDGIHVLMGEDGTVSNDDGTPVTQYVWGKFWVNNHAHVLTARHPLTNEHLLLLVQSLHVRPFITGAVQPKLSQGNLKSIRVVIPPANTAMRFGGSVGPLFDLVRSLTDESAKLAGLRDYLLPRLLSGRVRVGKEAGEWR